MPNSGAIGLFGIGATGGEATRLLSVLNENYKAVASYINGNGTHGTTSMYGSRVRNGPISVGGSFSLNPNALDLAMILPYIYGTTASGTTFALSDSQIAFVIQKKLSSTGNRVFQYPTNYVQRAVFSSSSGGPLQLDIDAVGLSEDTPDSTWTVPTIPSDSTGVPVSDMFVHSDINTHTIGGTTYGVRDVSLTIENVLVGQFLNSRTATAFTKTNRIITYTASIPESDAVYTAFKDSETTILPVVMTYTYGNESLQFTLPDVRFTAETPVIAGRGGENYIQLTGQAFRTAASLELVTVLDSTI